MVWIMFSLSTANITLYRTKLADLEQLDDQSLWQIATQKKANSDLELFDILLEKNKSGNLTETEQLQLKRLRYECDLFMLRKAHSAALLRWHSGISMTFDHIILSHKEVNQLLKMFV
jgi:hypothetical protein